MVRSPTPPASSATERPATAPRGRFRHQPGEQDAHRAAFGDHTPTLTFTATAGGVSVPASFSVDLGQIASIDASTGVLSPSGQIGGTANVTATYGGQKVSTQVTVLVQLVQNGAPSGARLPAGAPAATAASAAPVRAGPWSPGTQKGLSGQPPRPRRALAWLYPYDKTVWPQGLLAPLLQWTPGTGQSYDAIYIHLKENGFEYQGFFAAPATPFINHPVLQQAWDALSYSNQGEPVSVTLVFSIGGKPYGPLTETWSIAQGTLTGTVYYNSYGTSLVTNFCGPQSWGSGGTICFGGATLAIKRGATSPVLVAGANSPQGDQSGCRVCHSVAAGGATLITEHGDNS